MNLLEQIPRLVERSKHLNTIVWFPYSSPHSQAISDLNTALRVANETEQWQLFLALLPLWTTMRHTTVAKQIFERETPWQDNRPLVCTAIFTDSSETKTGRFSLHCGQYTICQIIGTRELIERYHREVTASGHTITLEGLNVHLHGA